MRQTHEEDTIVPEYIRRLVETYKNEQARGLFGNGIKQGVLGTLLALTLMLVLFLALGFRLTVSRPVLPADSDSSASQPPAGAVHGGSTTPFLRPPGDPSTSTGPIGVPSAPPVNTPFTVPSPPPRAPTPGTIP